MFYSDLSIKIQYFNLLLKTGSVHLSIFTNNFDFNEIAQGIYLIYQNFHTIFLIYLSFFVDYALYRYIYCIKNRKKIIEIIFILYRYLGFFSGIK